MVGGLAQEGWGPLRQLSWLGAYVEVGTNGRGDAPGVHFEVD